MPGTDAVNAACGVLEGIAVFDGPCHNVHNRIGWHEGTVYYDLADKRWRAIRIDQSGWQVVERPDVVFRRYAHQLPQVEPTHGGDVRQVLRFLNVRPKDRLLLLAFLVATFMPDIPHPIADFHGEKGSGKSVGQRVLRRLIDPSAVESLTFPTDVREFVQQLAHHYAPVYDNIDVVAPWVSDLLCRAVTGEGFSKRELYSDDDDVIYSYRRVLMLNGVNVVARRADLLDRTILIGLERISSHLRQEEKAFWMAFEEARPSLLGAVFDALAASMQAYPDVRLADLERMADFTRWGAAITKAIGLEPAEFQQAYQENIGAQTQEAVEGHIVGAAILALMQDRQEWSGSPTDLLAALENAGEEARLFRRSGNGRVEAKGWPGAPHILSRRLNEIRSNLRDLGLEIIEGRGSDRTVTIRRTPPKDGESSVDGVGSDDQTGKRPFSYDATADATDGTDFGNVGKTRPKSALPDACRRCFC